LYCIARTLDEKEAGKNERAWAPKGSKVRNSGFARAQSILVVVVIYIISKSAIEGNSFVLQWVFILCKSVWQA